MKQEAVLSILSELGDSGKLDKEVVKLVTQRAADCYQYALGESAESAQAYLDGLVYQDLSLRSSTGEGVSSSPWAATDSR
jgi:hypothetical protein